MSAAAAAAAAAAPAAPGLSDGCLWQEDRMLNSHKKPALKKLTLLPQVVMHLKK